jgi:antitoxin component HigA of HigAB toxin-antitoxin module
MVSDTGRVMRMASSRKIHSKWVTFPEKELGQRRIGAGYLAVGVKESGRSRTLYVHRLVAEAFLGKPSDKNEVNHIDGNKQNNNLANLEWTTHSANLQHAFKNELHKQRSLTPEEVKSIRAGLLIGKKADDLAAIYGVTKSAISHIKYRRSWRWLD